VKTETNDAEANHKRESLGLDQQFGSTVWMNESLDEQNSSLAESALVRE
jgi:hypothetical protein